MKSKNALCTAIRQNHAVARGLFTTDNTDCTDGNLFIRAIRVIRGPFIGWGFAPLWPYIAVVLHLGVLAGSTQTNIYLFSGSETNITLNPGAYIITAYGAPGGGIFGFNQEGYGGLGAEMSAKFNFSTSTSLILLVGGGGSPGYVGSGVDTSSGVGAGGGGGSFVVESNTPLVIAGGGGGGGDYSGNGSASAKGGNGTGNGGTGRGGTAGGGGGRGYGSGGGGGFLGNGSDSTEGGFSFENGGGGGIPYYGDGNGGGGGYGGGGAGASELNGSGGGGGGGGGYSGGGGGGNGAGGGGGGGSIIDSSALAVLAEVSGTNSPDDPTNGEIIIIAVPTPLAISTTGAALGFTNGVFGFDVTGPSGSNVVIQASTDLKTWIPLQTNLLGSGPLYFSDTNAPANRQRFYRVSLQ